MVKAAMSMSGSSTWLWPKKPALVARISPAQSPARRPKSWLPRRQVRTAVAMAANITGICAVVSVTRPRGSESKAMLQG